MVFYIDASIPVRVYLALAAVRHDVMYPGQGKCPITTVAAKDIEWLPVAGREGWAVILRDKKIRQHPGERRRLLDYGVKAFVLTGGGNYTSLQTLDLLLRHWTQIERAAAEPGPFCYSVTKGGLNRLALG